MTKEWHGDDIDPEDIVLEAENNEPPKGGDAEKKIAKLKAELEACQKEKQENLDGWQRSKADYVNLLRRSEQQTVSSKQEGLIKAVETLLPAFDALERAKEHVPSEALAKEGGELINGFLAVAKQLEGAFASLGLEEVGAAGDTFDPALHEAFGQDPVDSADADDTVTAVLEKGWRVNGTVIRPAKVRVGVHAAT